MDVSMFMFGIASLLESYSYEGSHEETKVQIGKLISRHKFNLYMKQQIGIQAFWNQNNFFTTTCNQQWKAVTNYVVPWSFGSTYYIIVFNVGTMKNIESSFANVKYWKP